MRRRGGAAEGRCGGEEEVECRGMAGERREKPRERVGREGGAREAGDGCLPARGVDANDALRILVLVEW